MTEKPKYGPTPSQLKILSDPLKEMCDDMDRHYKDLAEKAGGGDSKAAAILFQARILGVFPFWSAV